ncbi:MAG TPA: antibiotic biosynthesis monooxygenase [Opitutaceae bacterium]|nr:antibiotic biosynthesis monooxygenase [Opitutaceae bacterium]
MSIGFATTPEPPYLAVIFTSRLSPDDAGYAAMGAEMEALAAKQPGYLGIESARGADGVGITVSYWRDEESVRAWKAVARHRAAQAAGRAQWYERFEVRVARVERAYGGP